MVVVLAERVPCFAQDRQFGFAGFGAHPRKALSEPLKGGLAVKSFDDDWALATRGMTPFL